MPDLIREPIDDRSSVPDSGPRCACGEVAARILLIWQRPSESDDPGDGIDIDTPTQPVRDITADELPALVCRECFYQLPAAHHCLYREFVALSENP